MADGSLPKSTLEKYVKDALTNECKLAKPAMDLVVDCCNEFVLMITAKANEISEREHKNSINPEHVIQALKELEFDAYLDEVNDAFEAFKDDRKAVKQQKQESKKNKQGVQLTQEELIELQNKLFAEARAAALAADPSAMNDE